MIAEAIRWILKLDGRVLIKPRYHWGVDPFADIRRFAGALNIEVKSFFDVGAHEGETAIRALVELPGSTVVSFEPHPATFARLCSKMRRANGFVAVNSAVGNVFSDVMMTEYSFTKMNSLIENAPTAIRYGNQGTQIAVKCTTLDLYCKENQVASIDVLKIDTEGFDLIVLEGATELLKRRAIRFIYVEFNDLEPLVGAIGGALLPIDSFLRPFGFRFATSYLDSAQTEGKLFFSSNALFVLQP